jgi:lipopolysaccharide export system ATP-binding protein
MSQLIAKNLRKIYKHREVVADISITVKSGQIVGLLGPNGAGKTTCFYMIVGLVPCDKGEIFIDDENLTHMPMHKRARRGVGYLPQEPSVFRKLTVHDNIMAILEIRKDLTTAEREATLTQLLNEFNISHVKSTLGMSLSGGERRRVEIARAIAANPKFILLDEPFAGVDPISIIDIKEIIQHLAKRGIGVLITDHNVRETLDICETATIMGAGHLLAQGTPEAILADPKVRNVYLGEDFVL